MALGLRTSDTPPFGGKLFHQKVLADTISMVSLAGIFLNGSMFHMPRVRSLIVRICRSMLSCQLLDSVTAESRFRYFWGVRAELRIFYGVLLLQHSPTNESTEAGSYVAFVELLPITEITAICSTSSD